HVRARDRTAAGKLNVEDGIVEKEKPEVSRRIGSLGENDRLRWERSIAGHAMIDQFFGGVERVGSDERREKRGAERAGGFVFVKGGFAGVIAVRDVHPVGTALSFQTIKQG